MRIAASGGGSIGGGGGSSSSGGGSSGGSSSRGNRYNAVHSISMHIRSIVLSYMFFPQNIRERLPLRGSKWKTHC